MASQEGMAAIWSTGAAKNLLNTQGDSRQTPSAYHPLLFYA